MVLGILLQVAVLASLGDGGNHPGARLALQLLELLAKPLLTGDGHRDLVHCVAPACSSCSRRTVMALPYSSAMHTALAPARVVA